MEFFCISNKPNDYHVEVYSVTLKNRSNLRGSSGEIDPSIIPKQISSPFA